MSSSEQDEIDKSSAPLMEHLIGKGVPMRTAHEVVGRLVRLCEGRRCRLAELSAEEMNAAHPDLAPGGGGNTSVKSRDGRRIFVKASGTALKAMDSRRGWAELDLSALREILSVKGLAALPSREREAEVLRLLGGSVVRPPGARPSVESSLHALLDRVVIHTHPVGLNAFLSSRESRRRFSTPDLNRALREIIRRKQPPSDGGREVRLFYITQTGAPPPRFVVFTNGRRVDAPYRRYLETRLRSRLGLDATPIHLTSRRRPGSR